MKVLIVEDDPLTRKIMEDILTFLNYEYSSAQNGEVALDIIKREEFDVVLMDINMPIMDGIEATKKIREEGLNPLIIMLTSYGDEEMIKEAVLAGADDYLLKPIDINILKTKIETANKVKIFYKFKNEFIKKFEKDINLKEREIEKLINENSSLSFELLEKISKIAEFKDDETYEHTQRVGMLSYEIAKTIGMPYEFCFIIKLSSPLHDVGKIGIPDKILLKPEKLTKDEFEIMKKHTIIGKDILKGSKSPILKMGEIIAISHHERWDGTGYPNNLKGEEIPIEGRITNIADSIDAMASKRPYKEKYDEDKLLSELKDNKGKMYDPHFIDVVLSMWNKFRNLYYK